MVIKAASATKAKKERFINCPLVIAVVMVNAWSISRTSVAMGTNVTEKSHTGLAFRARGEDGVGLRKVSRDSRTANANWRKHVEPEGRYLSRRA